MPRKFFIAALAAFAVLALSIEPIPVSDWVEGFKGTENLAFDGKGNLYVTDTNTLWRVNAQKELNVFYRRQAETDGISLGGVSLGPGGKLYFSTGNRIMVLDPEQGSLSDFVTGLDFGNGNCFDDAGNFYIADANAKVLYVVPAGTKELKALDAKAGWVNGLVWSRKENVLYASISSPGKVVGYRLADGPSFTEKFTLASFPLAGLDDLTLDDNGNVYLCAWLNGKLVRITPEGEKSVLLDKLDGPSAAAFGVGENNQKLYVCIKGGGAKFEGTKIIEVGIGQAGYRLPFLPGPEPQPGVMKLMPAAKPSKD